MSLPHSSRWTVPPHGVRQVPPQEASALLEALRRATDHEPLFHADADRGVVGLEEAYQHCQQVIWTHSRSFFLSSQFLPAEKRKAIRALYALCRTTDDLVDQAEGDVEIGLARWVALVQAAQPPACDPVLVAWADTAQQYDVPQTLVNELLAGVAMDLTVKRYATFDDLWLYCYRVASVVGLLSMHIVGYRPGAQPYAVSLGIALQLTNILRDVGEDAVRGRIYLPQEDLERFGLADEDILSGRRDKRFRALMRYEIERAHTLYEESWPGMQLLSDDSRFAIGAAAQVYRGILGKIIKNDFDVFDKRAHLSLAEKLWVLPDVRRRLRTLEM